MKGIEALITSARRYLKDHFNYWSDKYLEERVDEASPYTDNDYNIFPRYNVLAAILDEVETLVGQAYMDLQTCKQDLKSIGLTANSLFTTGTQSDIATHAMHEERNKFVVFIESVRIEDLKSVEPLPYRRRMKQEESEQVRKALLENWNFQGGYWQPLEKLSPKPTLFIMKENISDGDYEQIIKAVQKNADARLFEITEDGLDAEIDSGLFQPDCYETIYCDRSYEWILYGSHESTIAFGGAWLLEFVRRLYNDRQDQINKWEVDW
ncbi:MAG: hypothetical protein EOP52_06150 [Sphingobacteriales bacterium]|nr:MAG: hypothetical protein EOP52_06150 [Sphingobacteriales bacterium]